MPRKTTESKAQGEELQKASMRPRPDAAENIHEYVTRTGRSKALQ